MPNAEPFPMVVCVDVEPDPRFPAPGEHHPWAGFERLLPAMQHLRRRLTKTTGRAARFAWFWRMDPQIEVVYGSTAWGLRTYAREIDALREEGDAIGIHSHAARWRDGWTMDHGDPEWPSRCVEISAATYRDELGELCRIHRAGDRWLDSKVVQALTRIRVEIDLTVEPGQPSVASTEDEEGPSTAPLPDLGPAPRVPYRPSVADPVRADPARDEGPWLMPLTSTEIPRSDLRRAAPGALPPGKPYRTLVPWHCTDPRDLWDVAERNAESMERPYLAFAMRSDIRFHAGEWRRFDRAMRGLARHPLGRRIELCTPEDALRRLGYVSAPSGARSATSRVPENARPGSSPPPTV